MTGRSGFAGFRIASAVAVASIFGGLAGAGVLYGLDRLDARASEVLRADLDQRAEAGRTAIAALESAQKAAEDLAQKTAAAKRQAARSRASAIALETAIGLERLSAGESSGTIDVAKDRVISSTWPVLSAGATVSKVLPDLWNRTKKNPVGAVEEDDRGILAFGPLAADGRLTFGRVESIAGAQSSPLTTDVARATNAIVGIAAPVDPISPPRSPWALLAFGGLFGAFIGFAWAKSRIGGPVEATLEAARAFVHGASDARANDKHGGRDARDVARAVNALIESAERLKLQGRAAREEDVRAMAISIRALGRGDLESTVPEVSDALSPVRDAIESTRKEMLVRIGDIQKMSIEVAENAADVAPNATKIARAAVEQVEALRALANEAQRATEDVKGATDRLGGAVKSLARFSDGERKAAREMQSALIDAGRRVHELELGTAQIEALAGTSVAIEEALDVLAQAGNADNPPSKVRITNAVGQGRAAMETMKRELASLREEMGEAAASLEAIAKTVPETGAELGSVVTQNLHEAAAKLLRIVERTATGIKVLERTAKVVSESASQIANGVAASADLAPRIGAIVAEFSVGQSFEETLLERLDRWKKAAEAAKTAPDGLSDDGRTMVKQVIEASEQARQRLARLVSVTENAIDVLRG